MKSIFHLILCILFFSIDSLAQYDPLLSQYMHMPSVFNSAAVGSYEKIHVAALIRRQWTQLKNAPSSNFFSADMPFNHARMGIGVNVLQESLVAENKLTLQAMYAYKINFSKGKLAFGMNMGIVNYRFDASKLAIKDEDDILLGNGLNSWAQPDFGCGLYYNSAFWEWGISVNHLIKHKSLYLNESSNKFSNFRQAYAYLKTNLRLSDKWELKPSLIARSAYTFNRLQGDMNAVFIFRDEVWWGMGYRTSQAVLFQAGFKLGKINKSLQDIRLHYNYDLYFSEVSSLLGPTHEIVLRAFFDTPKNAENILKKPKSISPLDL